MSTIQILFLLVWGLTIFITIYLIARSKKTSKFQKTILLIFSLLIPILGLLLVYFTLLSNRDINWFNSATRDLMWIAESDIENGSGSGDE